jgi:hypothetical protein
MQMTAVEAISEVLTKEAATSVPSPADLAVAAFLARYSNRTFEAYRHDLRTYFQWAANAGLEVFTATRGHIELYRATLEERGLAPSTIDRRLSTVCGFYRFAHIDGRIGSNPAQYVRRPRIFANEVRGMDRGELGAFLFAAERVDRMHAALAVLLGLNGLRVSEACATNVEDLGMERGHRTLRILGKGNKPAVIPLVPRTARTIDLAVGERSEGPILCRVNGAVSTVGRRTAGFVRSASEQASGSSTRTCCGPPSSWLPSMPAFRSGTSSSQPVTKTLGPRRSTTVAELTSIAMPPMSSLPSLRADDLNRLPPNPGSVSIIGSSHEQRIAE